MAKPRIVLTGATGFLGRYLAAELERRGLAFVTLGRAYGDLAADLEDVAAVARAVREMRPTHILNAAALATIAGCEQSPERAERVNAEAVASLASVPGARLLQVSTDMVFDGTHAPYAPDAEPRPLSVYAATKARGEARALAHADALVVRVPLLFGKSHDGTRGATDMIRAALAARQRVTLFTNEHRTPLHVDDAARALVELLLSGAHGIAHLPGPERISRAELGQRFVQAAGLEAAELLVLAPCDATTRPRDTSLTGAWRAARSLDAMLAES